MKTKKTFSVFIAISFIWTSAWCFASTEQSNNTKVYTFKYSYKNESYEVSNSASDYHSAFKKAAQSCFDHYRKKEKSLNEEKGVEIIDECANPSS